MMLQITKNLCLAMFLFVFFLCMTQYSIAIANDDCVQLDKYIQDLLHSQGMPSTKDNQKNEANIAKALQAYNESLVSDAETRAILKKWDDYLINVSHYSNYNYAKAIKRQVEDYQQLIGDIGEILKSDRNKRQAEYSSSWIDDLIKQFGQDYVSKNEKTISLCLLAISTPESQDFERKLKDLIYTEAMLYGSYREYLGLFLGFYKEKLNDHDKVKVMPQKNFAGAFLETASKAPLTTIYNKHVLAILLAENKAIQLNNDVFVFLKNHPLSHTIDYFKALEDLKKASAKP